MTNYGTDDNLVIGGDFIGRRIDAERKKEDKGFASILDDERSSIKDVGDISVKNTGYGPKGIPQSFMVEMHDYTFQKI